MMGIESWAVVGQVVMVDMDPTQGTTCLQRLPPLLSTNEAVGEVVMGGGEGTADTGGGADMEGAGGDKGCCWAGLVDWQGVCFWQICFNPNA